MDDEVPKLAPKYPAAQAETVPEANYELSAPPVTPVAQVVVYGIATKFPAVQTV